MAERAWFASCPKIFKWFARKLEVKVHPKTFHFNLHESPLELDVLAQRYIGFRQGTSRTYISPYEDQYYCRRLCRDTTVTVESVARHITRGSTERQIAAELAFLCYELGITPVALFITGDSYIDEMYYPRNYPVSHYVFLLLIGYRDGWCIPVTRAVALDTLPSELERVYEDVAWSSQFYFHQMRVGQPVPELSKKVKRFPEYWPHQLNSHLYVQPITSDGQSEQTEDENQLIESNQIITSMCGLGSVYATNTFIVRTEGNELLTRTNAWPERKLVVDRIVYYLPDILRL